MSTSTVPNPGTPEALERGCRCAEIDNGHGRGWMGQEGVFVYTAGCPLHWPNPATEPLPPDLGDGQGPL